MHRQPQSVEGIYNSEGELHLLDASTSIVYSTVRSKFGDLVPVGVYNREQQEIQLKAVQDDANCSTADNKVRLCELAGCKITPYNAATRYIQHTGP